jgi:hypothetical protein
MRSSMMGFESWPAGTAAACSCSHAECRAGHGSSVTISKDEFAEIAPSGYPEKADDRGALPKRSNTVSTAPADFRPNESVTP